jgi:hypothetical protein
VNGAKLTWRLRERYSLTMIRFETQRGPGQSPRRRTIAISVAACASSSLLMILAACGSKSGATRDGGADATDAQAGDAHATDARSPVDGGGRTDSGEGGIAKDAGEDRNSDAGDSGCETFDGGPYIALNWNEECSSTVTNFLIEWGRMDGGPYPNVADAGLPCDAAACTDGGSGERSCQYDLRGLDAGGWCVVTVACDETACSSPSGQACATIPTPCP